MISPNRMSRLFAGTPFDIPPTCSRCGDPVENCDCPAEQPNAPEWLPPSQQRVKVRRDRRKHKRVVTVIWGLSPEESDLKTLLSQLKSKCGAGGAIEDASIEIQGDHVQRVSDLLKQIGYRLG
jgi:translation initiation factor 1